jgi:undecaprenyl-diphosphatase
MAFKSIHHRVNKWSSAVALLTIEFVLLLIVFFIAIAILIILIRQVFGDTKPAIDDAVFSFLANYVSPGMTSVMKFFTALGSHQFLIPAFLLLSSWYYFIKRHKWYMIKILVIAASNLLLMFSLKLLFNRPRPLIPLLKEVPGLSFPSGHAFMSLTFFGLIMYTVYREVKTKWIRWTTIGLLCLLIFFIGISRVYLRVHYASDVVAGYCFGILSLMILSVIIKQIEQFNAVKISPALNITQEKE